MNTQESVTEEGLVEMFRRVGRTYPDPKLTKLRDWYTRVSWTEADQEDFRKWLVAHIRKKLRWKKKLAENSASWFLLMWGWTTLSAKQVKPTKSTKLTKPTKPARATKAKKPVKKKGRG